MLSKGEEKALRAILNRAEKRCCDEPTIFLPHDSDIELVFDALLIPENGRVWRGEARISLRKLVPYLLRRLEGEGVLRRGRP